MVEQLSRKKVAYIAGKITGDLNYRTKFIAAKTMVEKDGYIVLIPSVLPGGMMPEDYMRICLSMIDVADIVFFLPDYVDSNGASVEWGYCTYIGKAVECITKKQMDEFLKDDSWKNLASEV